MKIIVEVGSTVTKVDLFDGSTLKRINEYTILFKKHYTENKKLRESDILLLIDKINELKKEYDNIYVCGTSIFRVLDEEEKNIFLQKFKDETGISFEIISQDEENELTVKGATRNTLGQVCVFIGGGGSTEISSYDKEIIEAVNSNIGVIDILEVFPDLKDNFATTDVDTVKKYIKERLNLPKYKSDILILSGGGHEKFARCSGIKYEENKLYKDMASPIMMDIETRIKETERYFKEISLDDIRSKVEDPSWWDATRAMCAFVLVVAEAVDAKYIIPTDISMAYGLLNK